MRHDREVIDELEALDTLQGIVRSYGEIASLRMRNIRDMVVKNRAFLTAIDDVFQDVLLAYRQRQLKLNLNRMSKKNEQITFLSHNGKTVKVLLSANTGLYGSVQDDTFRTFIKDLDETECEATIIGKHGLSLFSAEKGENYPYTYFDFPDYGTNQRLLAAIIKHLVQYTQVDLYYPRFESVIAQTPATLSISSETFLQPRKEAKLTHEYIFEPTIEGVLAFFETEVFVSLFDQTTRESQLAKFASRITAMDSADENIGKRRHEVVIIKQVMEHLESNRRQQTLMSSVFLQEPQI